MYVRLSFDSNQRISMEDLRDVEKTLSDSIEYAELCSDEDGKLQRFNSYWNTYSLEDLKKEDNKKKLVSKSDIIELETSKEYFADLDLFLSKHPNIKIKIRGMVKTLETNFTSLMDQIQAIQSKFENALKEFDKHIEFNEKCEVHIGNLGLLHINQLGYTTNSCTEELQSILNKGWRILAVCPQPDQRRPDYMLGRYNPNAGASVECVKF